VFCRQKLSNGPQVIFRDGVARDVTASFQVFMPPNASVKNITLGFGGDGVIGYIDLNDEYGDGSFALASQTPGCDEVRPSASPSPFIGPT
jgi:hypothetical protein